MLAMSNDATVAAQILFRPDSPPLLDHVGGCVDSGAVGLRRIEVSVSETSSIYFQERSQLVLALGVGGRGSICPMGRIGRHQVLTQEHAVRIASSKR